MLERLTYRSVTVRPVLVPLRRPIVSKVGLFDEWPIILIDLETEEGIVGRSYLEISDTRPAISCPLSRTW